MNLIEKLNWRYAVKRMNGTKVPQEKVESILEAIRLAPTSLGLQAFKVFVQVTQNWLSIKFDEYIQLIATTRNTTVEGLNDFKAHFNRIVNDTAEHNFAWTSRQAYIAFGVGIAAAAIENVDATPMEGFNAEVLDTILGLSDQNLSAVTILTIGYRDNENDYLVNAAKVRKSKETMFSLN